MSLRDWREGGFEKNQLAAGPRIGRGEGGLVPATITALIEVRVVNLVVN